MSENAREEQFELVELFRKTALFTNFRIDRATVPEGLYCYDLRGSDSNPGKPITVEEKVAVNHAGTVLTTAPIPMHKGRDYRRISGNFCFCGEDMMLSQFCEEQGIPLPPDNQTFTLRPASPDEAGLFYSQMESEQDAALATVGHLRMDFGHKGTEFWSTWWEHNGNEFNTPALKAELESLVNELRASGPLKNLNAMSGYCYEKGVTPLDSSGKQYGFVAESEQYRYCLRCNPQQGDYNGYLYIYDKRQQELAMRQEPPEQGMEMGGMKFE